MVQKYLGERAQTELENLPSFCERRSNFITFLHTYCKYTVLHYRSNSHVYAEKLFTKNTEMKNTKNTKRPIKTELFQKKTTQK